MLDIEFVRENPEKVQQNARDKGFEVDVKKLLKLDSSRRELIKQTDDLRAEQNKLSKNIKGRPSPAEIAQAKQYKDQLEGLQDQLREIENQFEDVLKTIPNISSEDTPVGHSEDENTVVDSWGEKPDFDFKPKNHWEIAEKKDWIDKERAAKVTGSRFAYIKGPLVKLQFAIMNWVIDSLADSELLKKIIADNKLDVPDKPFVPVLPPQIIGTEAFSAMDRLEPAEDRYKLEGEELWLQGSAEHVLGAMHMNEILDADQLPVRYVGYATSFRREAGSYGKDMEGIIRMHQFDKLEVEILASPESGLQEHLFTIGIQEYFMQRLKIPYQKLLKCTADIGKPNARGVDLNSWLPGQGKYRETHTADFMTDYQARRLQTKVRKKDGSVTLVHTIDATALALGRTMVAIIENYQTSSGGVKIPEVLKEYMKGKDEL